MFPSSLVIGLVIIWLFVVFSPKKSLIYLVVEPTPFERYYSSQIGFIFPNFWRCTYKKYELKPPSSQPMFHSGRLNILPGPSRTTLQQIISAKDTVHIRHQLAGATFIKPMGQPWDSATMVCWREKTVLIPPWWMAIHHSIYGKTFQVSNLWRPAVLLYMTIYGNTL